MASLWDYLTQPSRGGTPIDKSKLADETLYTATAVPRFIARTGKSVYDSFKRGITPLQFGEDPYLRREQNIEDAFNVASAAMVGGMPGVPKGNSPGTLGMAFRRPKDVVYTTKGEFNPTSPTLKEDFGDNYDLYNLISRYHNKKWGTVDDPVIQHIDKGFRVPEIPGLNSHQLNRFAEDARAMPLEALQAVVNREAETMDKYYPRPVSAKTLEGQYVERYRDRRALDTISKQSVAARNARGLSKETKNYVLTDPDIKMFAKPSILDLASTKLPYKIEGNLNRMSLADMLMQATEKEATAAKIPDELLHEFDDGHYWTQLKTQAQREAESEAMGNSTRLPIHDGKELYSLRDKNGKSILTASRQPGRKVFDEIKTRFNKRDILDELQLSTRKDNEYYDKYLGLFTKLGMDK